VPEPADNTGDQQPDEAESRSPARELLIGSGAYTAGILVSRLLGAVRQILVQDRFGPGLEQDAFLVAESLPRAASGQLTDLQRSCTVPVLGKMLAEGEERSAWRLQAWAMALTGLVLMLSAGLVAVFPGPLARLMSPMPYTADQEALVGRLLRLLIIGLAIEGTAGLATAGWLAHRRYVLPGLAHLIPNLVVVATLMYGGTTITIDSYAGGTVGGALLFALVVGVPFAVAIKLPRALGWPPPWQDLRHVMRLAGPLVIPAVLAPVAAAIERSYAASLQFGTLSCLRTAQTALEGPLGTLVAAMSTVLLPVLAHQAARGREGFRERVNGVLRLVLLVTTPAVVLTVVYADPFVRALFQHGKFTATDTELTTRLIRILAWSSLLAGAQGVFRQAYLAVEEACTVSFVAVLSLGVGVLAYVVLFPALGLSAVLIGEIACPACSLLLLAWVFGRRLGTASGGRFLAFLVRLIACGAVVAGLAVALGPRAGAHPPGALREVVHVLLSGAACLAVYIPLTRLLLPEEYGAIRRRLRGAQVRTRGSSRR